jgi:VWFA-related protein
MVCGRPAWCLVVILAGVTARAGSVSERQTAAAIERTVYFTARHQSGPYVADLTPADLIVREAGREREILSVRRSSLRLKICLAIDEALSPDAVIRQAAQRFVEQFQGSADIALYLAGHGNAKLVDYTANAAPLQRAIASLPQRAQGGGNLVESLYELAKSQRSIEGRRALVILASELPQRTTVTANGVLDQLRDNGIVLYAVTLVGPAGTVDPPTPETAHLETIEEVERDRALNDGTRQSGGLRIPSMRVDDFVAALDRIRGELLNQYELTYVLPPGAKSDGRVSLASKRRGITVRAPSQLPKL